MDDQTRIDELEVEVERLRREVERQRRLGRQAADETRRVGERYRDIHDRLTATRTELKALRERRSVRLALDMSRSVRRWRTRLTSWPNKRTDDDDVPRRRSRHRPASQDEERRFVVAAAARLAKEGTPPESGPLVSVVMLNRDGVGLLRRCLPALAATAYRDIELIVVDNGSLDDSLEFLATFRPPFEMRVIRNEANATFSEGNNQGIASSRGELVLFLNNDIEPLEPKWLGRMVETAGDPDVAAVGPRLIYPRRTSEPVAGAQFADFTLQHAGIAFRIVDGAPLPVPVGAGEDALSKQAVGVRDVPALTAACLLVRRSSLEDVGGFSPGYDYGQEDVDLCLKLQDRGGRLVYDGRAALWHHESSTRNLEEREARLARTVANRDRFIGQWGPRLYRTVLGDALVGGRFWHADPFRLAVSGPTADLDDRARGWAVSAYEAARADRGAEPHAVLVREPGSDGRDLPPSAIRIAWIEDRLDDWLASPGSDAYDIIVVPDADAAAAVHARWRRPAVATGGGPDPDQLTDVIGGWLAARRVGLRITVPSWDVAEGWGDLHFARDVQQALEEAGHPSRVHLRPDWDSWWAARDDVGLHLLGRAVAARQRPGRLEVLWHISHPDAASSETYEAHDLVFVASDSFARWMDQRVVVPVRPLHQATDPRRFDTSMTGPHHELLFVANSRGVRRHILEDLLPTTHELAVYGKSWTPERLDPRYVVGERVPNAEVGGYYASADIVLNDHWPDMQREGFLSNRLYDASAAGAFVISDGIEGLEAEFDGGVVAYEDAADLHAVIERFLADPQARREHATRARAAVLARHTFERRIEEMLAHLRPLLAARPAAFAGRATVAPQGRRRAP